MHIGSLTLVAMLAQASTDSVVADTAQVVDSVRSVDTLPAVQLQAKPFYLTNKCGEDQQWLDRCYTFLRDLLVTANHKNWKGNFTCDELEKRFSVVKNFPKFRSALFMIDYRRGAVYVSYPNNPDFVPTIALENDQHAGLLTYRYTSSVGTTEAWASPVLP